MQKLIDYNKVEDIIKKSRNHHVEKFCDYKWSNDLTIDDVIVEAKTTKALELALRDIKALVPPNDDMVLVENALVALACHDDINDTPECVAYIKTIADYLGIALPN